MLINYDTLSVRTYRLNNIYIYIDYLFELCIMFVPVIVNRKNKQNMK